MRRDSPEPGSNRNNDPNEDPDEGRHSCDSIPLFPRVPTFPQGNKVIYLDARPATKPGSDSTQKPGSAPASKPGLGPASSGPQSSPPLTLDSSHPALAEDRHGWGTLRPAPIAPAHETLNQFESDFLGTIQIILGNLRNLQIHDASIKKDPLFNEYDFAFYLSWKSLDYGKRFSKEQVQLFDQCLAVKNDWANQMDAIGNLYNTWHNKLFTLINELKKSGRSPELLEKAKNYLESLRDANYGKMGWQITAENVEHFQKFVAANLGESDA